MHRTKLAGAFLALGALTATGCETEIVTPLVAALIVVDPHEADLSPGDDLQLTATVFDEASRSITRAEVEWTADDQSVVSVDSGGRARAVAPGATLIWATFEGVAGSASITVHPSAECAPTAAKPKDRPKRKKDDKGRQSHDGDDEDDDDDDDDDEGDDDDDEDDDESGGEDEGEEEEDDDHDDDSRCTASAAEVTTRADVGIILERD